MKWNHGHWSRQMVVPVKETDKWGDRDGKQNYNLPCHQFYFVLIAVISRKDIHITQAHSWAWHSYISCRIPSNGSFCRFHSLFLSDEATAFGKASCSATWLYCPDTAQPWSLGVCRICWQGNLGRGPLWWDRFLQPRRNDLPPAGPEWPGELSG